MYTCIVRSIDVKCLDGDSLTLRYIENGPNCQQSWYIDRTCLWNTKINPRKN